MSSISEQPVSEVPSSTPAPPLKKRTKAPMSPFLKSQMELQNELGCDYVLVWYERDPKSPPGQMPNYLRVGEPIPVKLSHQVFMQMAFGVLKDRLSKAPSRRRVSAPAAVNNNAPNAHQDAKEAQGTDDKVKGTDANSVSSPTNELNVKKAKNGPVNREKDTVALFCFLWQYVKSMLEAQNEAIQIVSAGNYSSRGKNMSPPGTVHMTKQQLRFQILLEYGVDVHKSLGDGLPTANALSDEYFREFMTDGITEEEFYQQLAKSSKMAQVCSVM